MLPSLTLLPIPVDHLQVLDQMQPPSMPLSLLLSPRMLEDQQVHWHHKQRDELLLLVLLHGMRIKSEQLQMYQNPEQEEMLGEIPVVGLQQLVVLKPLDRLLLLLNLQTLLNQSHHRLLMDL